MITKMSAADWLHHIPETTAEGEVKSCLIPLSSSSDTAVSVAVRSTSSLIVNLIDQDGQTVFLSSGQVVETQVKLSGFSAVEIVASSPFAYSVKQKGRWLEVPDPRKLTVEVEESTKKPLQDLVRAELQKALLKLEASSALARDVDVEELLDDIDNGDMDFEEEPDPFGLGYEEALEAFKKAQADDQAPPAEPLEPAPTPAGDGSQIAEGPGGNSSST